MASTCFELEVPPLIGLALAAFGGTGEEEVFLVVVEGLEAYFVDEGLDVVVDFLAPRAEVAERARKAKINVALILPFFKW